MRLQSLCHIFAVMPQFGPPSASPTSPILCLVFLQVSRWSSHKLWVGGVKKLQPKLGQIIIPSKRTASTWRGGAIGTSALSLEFLALRLEVIWHCAWGLLEVTFVQFSTFQKHVL